MFTTIICSDTKEKVYTYKDYLNTHHWKKIKEGYIQLYGEKCEVCGDKGEELHHLHYESLGEEAFDDLVLLCKECHRNEHDNKKITLYLGSD